MRLRLHVILPSKARKRGWFRTHERAGGHTGIRKIWHGSCGAGSRAAWLLDSVANYVSLETFSLKRIE